MMNRTGIGGNKGALSIGLLVAALGLSALLGGRVQAVAQSADQAAQVVKALDSNSKAVVGRLTELNQLPADEWRFHAGDLAHGETTELDDSSCKW